MVSLRACILLALTTQSACLRFGAVVNRRTAVLAAAGSLGAPWLTPPNAYAVGKEETAAIIKRASEGKLSTEAVIGRALRNDMLDPKQLIDCATLDNVAKIDNQAGQELQLANSKLSKLAKAAAKNTEDGDADEKEIVDTLNAALKISSQAEQRISSRVSMIMGRYNSECLSQ